MTNYEILTISVSCVSAVVALSALALNRRTAAEQKTLKHAAFHQDSRALAATHHAPYSELLFQVEQETEQATGELTAAAHEALDRIYMLVDQHSTESGLRPARHLYHEACELIFRAFKGQLGWQRGLNLVSRYQTFRYGEDFAVDPNQFPKLRKQVRKELIDFERWYKEDPNEALERRLVASPSFVLLLENLRARLPEDRRQALFHSGLEAINEYRAAHHENEDSIRRGYQKLKDGLVKNTYEEFSLKESPRLFQRYTERMAKLETLAAFSLPNWGNLPATFRVDSPTQQLVYAGAILYTVQLYWAWGSG